MKTKLLLTTLIAGALCQLAAGTSHAQEPKSTPPATIRGPREVIIDTLQTEIGRKLKEAGATFDSLQVAVAVDRDSATPFKVSYQGLKNFPGADGTTPDADGSFIMNYVGGAKYLGALAGTEFSVPVGKTDNIDLPFVNDPAVVGEWESVDFVADIADFKPGAPNWSGDLYLKGLTFLENGKTAKPSLSSSPRQQNHLATPSCFTGRPRHLAST